MIEVPRNRIVYQGVSRETVYWVGALRRSGERHGADADALSGDRITTLITTFKMVEKCEGRSDGGTGNSNELTPSKDGVGVDRV